MRTNVPAGTLFNGHNALAGQESSQAVTGCTSFITGKLEMLRLGFKKHFQPALAKTCRYLAVGSQQAARLCGGLSGRCLRGDRWW
jgi:hypothetical protein